MFECFFSFHIDVHQFIFTQKANTSLRISTLLFFPLNFKVLHYFLNFGCFLVVLGERNCHLLAFETKIIFKFSKWVWFPVKLCTGQHSDALRRIAASQLQGLGFNLKPVFIAFPSASLSIVQKHAVVSFPQELTHVWMVPCDDLVSHLGWILPPCTRINFGQTATLSRLNQLEKTNDRCSI